MSPSHSSRPPRSETSGRGGRGWLWLLAGVLVLVLVIAGGIATAVHLGDLGSTPAASSPQSPAVAAPAPTGPILASSAPTAVSVPAIGARGPLQGLGLDARHQMATPPLSHPERASWYTGGPQPGQQGPAVILGHINGDGHPGVFGKLAQARPGDTIEVARADHTVATFAVDRLAQITKDAFPADAVFGPTSDAQLRLISCGGDLDASRHSYKDNIIVYAHLTGSHQG